MEQSPNRSADKGIHGGGVQTGVTEERKGTTTVRRGVVDVETVKRSRVAGVIGGPAGRSSSGIEEAAVMKKGEVRGTVRLSLIHI